MKSSDRMILVGVALLGLCAAFYFLILAPKRQEASDLKTQVTELEASVVAAEQAAAAGEQAKADFDGNYRRLVTLGKAVPLDADTPSLLIQMQGLSDKAKVDFRSISLSAGAGAAPTAPATTPTATAATETAAALMPIGATVGPAGLPTMGYTMQFDGGFFGIADFFGEIDDMVEAESDGETVSVDGRLLTIDAFSLAPGPNGLPDLTAEVQATSYLTPADQGITGGATAAGPAAVPATTTPAPTDGSSPVAAATGVAN